MKNRKIILTLFALIFMISIVIMSGCGIEEETTEYIFPEIAVTTTGQTADSAIEELKPSGSKDDLVTSIRKGTDGSIIIELTDTQLGIWLNDIEEKIEQAKKDAETIGCEIDINDDRTKFTYNISKNANAKQVALNGAIVISRCMQYQIFNEVSPDEIKLNTVFINIKTGKVLADVNAGEEVTINPEDWDE